MMPHALQRLFDSLGVEFMAENRYEPPALAHRDVRRTRYYRRNRREFEALETRYRPLLAGSCPSGDPGAGAGAPMPDVRHLGGLLGYGLFAGADLAAGDLIGEYLGIVRPARPGRPLPGGGYSSDYAWGFPKVRTLGRSLEIDAREAGGILRFANHSSVPNAFPEHLAVDGRWRIIFVALKSIRAGEEITVDYGEAYWAGGEREMVGPVT